MLTGSNMLATAGATTRAGKAGMKGVTVDPGKSAAPESSSAINIYAKTAGVMASPPKRPASITSYPKRVAVQTTIPIWSRCAGPAIERKQQQREPDE